MWKSGWTNISQLWSRFVFFWLKIRNVWCTQHSITGKTQHSIAGEYLKERAVVSNGGLVGGQWGCFKDRHAVKMLWPEKVKMVYSMTLKWKNPKDRHSASLMYNQAISHMGSPAGWGRARIPSLPPSLPPRCARTQRWAVSVPMSWLSVTVTVWKFLLQYSI